MSVGGVLLWSFILIPILEIYLLMEVGSLIGFWATLGIILLTAIVGSFLLRIQGVYTLQKVQTALNRGEIPAKAMMDGILLLIGGVLLLTPGFFTDGLGLMCLLPGPRDLISHFLSKQLIAQQLKQRGFSAEGAATYQRQQQQAHRQTQQSEKTGNVTIEGQYTKED